MEANPHAEMKPRIPRIVIRHVAEPASQLLLLQKGDADIAGNLNADQLKGIVKNPDYGISKIDQLNSLYLGLNALAAAVPEDRGAPGDQVGDRLRRDRRQHHAERVGRLADLPAEGLAWLDPRSSVQEGCREGQGAARRRRLSGRLRHGAGLSPFTDIAAAVQHDLATVGIRRSCSPARPSRSPRRSCSCCRAPRSGRCARGVRIQLGLMPELRGHHQGLTQNGRTACAPHRVRRPRWTATEGRRAPAPGRRWCRSPNRPGWSGCPPSAPGRCANCWCAVPPPGCRRPMPSPRAAACSSPEAGPRRTTTVNSQSDGKPRTGAEHQDVADLRSQVERRAPPPRPRRSSPAAWRSRRRSGRSEAGRRTCLVRAPAIAALIGRSVGVGAPRP